MTDYRPVRHFEVYVHLDSKEEIEEIEQTVCKAAMKLSEVSSVSHLRITFGYTSIPNERRSIACQLPVRRDDLRENELQAYAHVLQPFSMLRNVNRVEVLGSVKSSYSRYLQNIMEGNTSDHPLRKMLGALEHSVSPYQEYKPYLATANKSIRAGKIEDFKMFRTFIASKVRERVESAFNNIYSYDAENLANPELGHVFEDGKDLCNESSENSESNE